MSIHTCPSLRLLETRYFENDILSIQDVKKKCLDTQLNGSVNRDGGFLSAASSAFVMTAIGGFVMDTLINLTGDGRYVAEFATYGVPGAGLLQFGWVYIAGNSGAATVEITDTDGVTRPPQNVPVPGMFASVLRQSSPPRLTQLVIKAGNEGFRGELHFDLTNWR
jgi:hypothetical protein